MAPRHICFNEDLPVVRRRIVVELTGADAPSLSVGLIAATLAAAGASVGMLATEAKRFRSGEDRDGGSSGAPEPSSQRKRARLRDVIRS